MAGLADVHHDLCLSLALWNGVDPILKERMCGLGGPEGNHGEDVKECWWYLEGLPSHALLRWRYHYPQAPFPYEDLRAENAQRSRLDPEYELIDTGVFDDGRFWIVEVTYAKASPTEILCSINIENHGADAPDLHVLPTLWLHSSWRRPPHAPIPRRTVEAGPVRGRPTRWAVSSPWPGPQRRPLPHTRGVLPPPARGAATFGCPAHRRSQGQSPHDPCWHASRQAAQGTGSRQLPDTEHGQPLLRFLLTLVCPIELTGRILAAHVVRDGP